jgi:hypothetical protein
VSASDRHINVSKTRFEYAEFGHSYRWRTVLPLPGTFRLVSVRMMTDPFSGESRRIDYGGWAFDGIDLDSDNPADDVKIFYLKGIKGVE